ncbi:hypothetical protein FB451DRAFT_1179335 [Mycena latifolia]|nr:hypothetical protein FB451DRAFT_1179335 [Mycena latifolia]
MYLTKLSTRCCVLPSEYQVMRFQPPAVTRSSSQSKSWLRVGTPLLYNVVIIRSKAQAQALGSACGLCPGLPFIDPVRIILHYNPSAGSWIRKEAVKLLEVLQECIPKWKNLPNPWLLRDVTEINPVHALQQDIRLQALFDLASIVEPPAVPFVYPASLAADPELEDRIWCQVLYLLSATAMQSRAPTLSIGWPSAPRNTAPLRELHIKIDIAMHRFTERLDQQTARPSPHPDGYQVLASILSRTPSLVELVCANFNVTWKVPVGKPIVPGSTIFSQFLRLRCLTWGSKLFKPANSISSSTFNTLVELSIEAFDSSFLTVLTHIECVSLFIWQRLIPLIFFRQAAFIA